jgi:hypothetical protein
MGAERGRVKVFFSSLRGAKQRSNPVLGQELDCFAEPVIGRRFEPARWLAMTTEIPHRRSK